jgi:tetratricopeptide (TPR) repeat protein
MQPMRGFNRRYQALFIGVFLMVLTAAVFWPVTGHDFVNYDDDQYVTENRQVRQGVTLQGVRWAFATFQAGNWHPLTWLSHMLDVTFYGLDPAGHHLTNLLIHGLNVLLLFVVLLRMTGGLWPSACVAALFALHPLHVESVAWVAERKDVLSTCCGLLAIAAHVRYAARPTGDRYLGVLCLFALSLMAKPMLVTLPVILLLLDYWPLGRLQLASGARRTVWPLLKEKFPLLLLSAASGAVTVLAQQQAGAIRTFDALSLWARVENALVAYVGYMGKTLWPDNLAVFYPHPGSSLPPWQVAGAVLLLGGITVLVALAGNRRPYLFVGWSWYLVTLVPVIGLIQIGSQAVADRYTYVPLIGLFIMLAWGAAELTAGWRHQRAVLVVAAALLFPALMGITWLQVRVWRNSVTLFERALAVTTSNYIAHDHLGLALVRQGRVEEALPHYAEALRIKPNHVGTLTNLADAMVRQGRLDEAAGWYSDVLRLHPDDARTHNNLGNVYRAQGRWEEAVQQYREALRLQPDLGEPHNNLGMVYRQLGRLEEAVQEYREAIDIAPDLEDAHYNLGNAYLALRRFEEAVGEYRAVIAAAPSHVDARNNLGGAYLALGRLQEAVKEFETALTLRPDAEAHYNLGLAYGKQGEIRKAREQFGAALQLKPEYERARFALQSLPP